MNNEINTKNDGKPVSKDISGMYRFNNEKNEYIYLNSKFNNSEKKPLNLLLSKYNNMIWVNHTDFSAIICDYIDQETTILFKFNNVSYSIPKIKNYDDSIGEYVYIVKND